MQLRYGFFWVRVPYHWVIGIQSFKTTMLSLKCQAPVAQWLLPYARRTKTSTLRFFFEGLKHVDISCEWSELGAGWSNMEHSGLFFLTSLSQWGINIYEHITPVEHAGIFILWQCNAVVLCHDSYILVLIDSLLALYCGLCAWNCHYLTMPLCICLLYHVRFVVQLVFAGVSWMQPCGPLVICCIY
jgi:hypothetical protein